MSISGEVRGREGVASSAVAFVLHGSTIIIVIAHKRDEVRLTCGPLTVTGTKRNFKLYAQVDGDKATAEVRLGDSTLPISHDLFTELSERPELEDYYLEETL